MDNRQKTLIIFAVALVAILAYALMPDYVSYGDAKLKKVSLASIEKKQPDSTVAAKATQAGKAKKAGQAKKATATVDTSRLRILLFGDSMCEGLTRRLDDYAGENGDSLSTFVWYSSSTELYAKTNVIETLIKRKRPQFIIIALGSNELFVRDLEQRDQNIKAIIGKLGDTPYVWIGPPNWKKDTGIDSLILANVGKERYFDSSHLKLVRGKDHVHPTFTAAGQWMDLIAQWLSDPNKTAYPIRMKKPTKGYHSKIEVAGPDFKGYPENNSHSK